MEIFQSHSHKLFDFLGMYNFPKLAINGKNSMNKFSKKKQKSETTKGTRNKREKKMSKRK